MSLRRLAVLLGVAVFLFALMRLLVFETIVIASASMEPALPVGGKAILDKLTYRFREPRRGDIVLFDSPVPPHAVLGKRVIGVAGDTIELKRKAIYLNGALQAEPYATHTRSKERLIGDELGPWKVPEGSLFLLGDNRDESEDSTAWKDSSGKAIPFVPVESVRGIVRTLPR